MHTEDRFWGKRGHKVMVKYLHTPKNGKVKEGCCQFDLTEEQKALFLAEDRNFLDQLARRIYTLQVVEEHSGDKLSIAKANFSDARGKRVPHLTIL